jgi:selenophosphate synthase
VSDREIISCEPATGAELWRGEIGNVDEIVLRARRAWPQWAALPLAQRIELMRRFANEVLKEQDKFAELIAVLRDYGVGALTDVSGFGLLGHLGEMLRASRLGAVVRTADVATLPGALGCLTAGHASSLQAGNALALTDFELQGLGPADAAARIRVDTQTSGGLFGAVPAASAAECVAALRRAGYPQAAVIGTVTDGPWRVEAV